MPDYHWPMQKYAGEAARFRFPFPGLEAITQNYSQAMQDMFVLAALNGKRNGTWLEVGAFDPVYASNTYLLEQQFGWSGISIDRNAACEPAFKTMRSNTRFVVADATRLNYRDLLRESNLRIDYLSLDIEPAEQTLACLLALQDVPHRFSVITYEHDYYAQPQQNARLRAIARRVLAGNRYVLVAGNICINEKNEAFEDWYLDGLHFSSEVIRVFQRDSDEPIACSAYLKRAASN